VLQWATLNGAKALNIDDKYGSFEKGKQPGINLIKDNKVTVIHH
jgi:cytosine/adenosine deaminase-related metal-dependent hydrolase